MSARGGSVITALWDPDAGLWSFSAHVTPPQIDPHQILMNGDFNQSPQS